MAKCGVERIDTMYGGLAASPLVPGDADAIAVGVVQDLLSGHGYGGLPDILSSAYGKYGPVTSQAVEDFRARNGLTVEDNVDAAALKAMVLTPASDPCASRGYMAMVLDLTYGGMDKVLSVVAQMEGAGKFAALNLNSDGAGLSFGIIQWAQKPGRLAEILGAFRQASLADFVRIFAEGSAVAASGLINHVQRPSGGTDGAGHTTDPAFNLVSEPWVSRFKAAAAFRPFQAVQIRVALDAFNSFYERLRNFAPGIVSERGVAFMIDLSNQHGPAGAEAIYQAVYRPAMTERDLLTAMVDESVRRMQAQFKEATRARRERFLTTAFLSEDPFAANLAGAVGAASGTT